MSLSDAEIRNYTERFEDELRKLSQQQVKNAKRSSSSFWSVVRMVANKVASFLWDMIKSVLGSIAAKMLGVG